MPSEPFDIHVRPAREHLVIALVGDLDCCTAGAVRAAIEDACEVGWRDFVIDVRAVSFMDSAGVHLLLDLHRRATADGLQVAMTDPPRAVRRVLELTDTEHAVPRIDDGLLAA